MTAKQFSQKDAELLTEINEYRRQCFDYEAQIAINNREITRLEQERVELRNQFVIEEEQL